MYRIEKSYSFEAGHQLTHHDGKCCQPHGHSYKLVVVLEKQDLISSGPKTNMVMDFGDISKIVKPMIETYLDHKWLNDSLQSDSPTAEFIANWILEYLKPKIPTLYAISIFETETSKVTCFIS